MKYLEVLIALHISHSDSLGSYKEKEGYAGMKKSPLPMIFLLMTISLLIFTGCWDRKDIENRGYVWELPLTPILLKILKQRDKAIQEEFEETKTAIGQPIYKMTVQLPIIKDPHHLLHRLREFR